MIEKGIFTERAFATLEQMCVRMGWTTHHTKMGDLVVEYPIADAELADWILEI